MIHLRLALHRAMESLRPAADRKKKAVVMTDEPRPKAAPRRRLRLLA